MISSNGNRTRGIYLSVKTSSVTAQLEQQEDLETRNSYVNLARSDTQLHAVYFDAVFHIFLFANDFKMFG